MQNKYLFTAGRVARAQYYHKIVEDAKQYNADVTMTPDAFLSERRACYATFSTEDEMLEKMGSLYEVAEDLKIDRLYIYVLNGEIPHFVKIDNYIFAYGIIDKGKFKNHVQVLGIAEAKRNTISELKQECAGRDTGFNLNYYVITYNQVPLYNGRTLNFFSENEIKRNDIFKQLRRMIKQESGVSGVRSGDVLLTRNETPLFTFDMPSQLYHSKARMKRMLDNRDQDEFAVIYGPSVAQYVLALGKYIFLCSVSSSRIHVLGVVNYTHDLYVKLKKAYEDDNHGDYPVANAIVNLHYLDRDALE